MTAVKNKEECSKVLKKFAPPVKKTGEESSVQGQDTAALNEEVYVTSEDVSSMDQAEGIDAETQNTGAKDDRKKKAGKSNVVKKPRRKRKEEVGNAKKAPDTEDKENVLEASTGEVMQPVKTPKEQCHLTDLQYEDLFQRVLQKSAQDYMEYSEKILEPIPKAEEQKMSRKTCTMSKTAEDSTRAEVSGELCSAKKMPPEMTQKKLGLAGPKPHKLSLNQRKKKEEETEEIMEGRKRTRKGQPKKIVAGYTQITDQEETEDEQEPLNIKFNTCDIPEESWSGSDDEVIYATFVPGSIVWAKQYGYPWWPGMVEADPDIGVYFLFTSNIDQLPSKYHVTFFGDSVSRAWIASSMLKNFQEMAAEGLDLKKGKNKEYSKRFAIGLKMAEEAEKMNIQERIDKFGFSGRYRHNEESEQPGFREEDFDVCGNDKRHTTSTKITNCEQKSHAPNELPITATKEVENIGEKEDHTLQSKPVCQNEKKRPMFKKIRNCEPKLCLSKKSVTTMAKKVENIKEKDVHELESKPGPKKRFSLPKRRSNCPKPPTISANGKEKINNACDSGDMQTNIDSDKPVTSLRTKNTDKKDTVAQNLATSLVEEGSLGNWLEEVKANEKELEDAFADDMLDILTAKQSELQEDEFSLLLNEESHEP